MVLGAIIGAVGGALGTIGQAQSQNDARKAQQKAIERQYKYDKKVYDFNWKQTQREYDYRKKEVQTTRENNEANATFQEQSALDNFKYQLAIRSYQYKQQVDLYDKSNEIFMQQLGYNRKAASLALKQEINQLDEITKGLKFEAQNQLVEMMQNQGAQITRLQSGRSSAKAMGAAMAQYGRDQAVMAEELTSARRATGYNMGEIAQDYEFANLTANANRRLRPDLQPEMEAPRPIPRPTLLDPLKPEKPPKPIKGANTVPGANSLTIASGLLGAGVQAYNAFSSLQAPKVN